MPTNDRGQAGLIWDAAINLSPAALAQFKALLYSAVVMSKEGEFAMVVPGNRADTVMLIQESSRTPGVVARSILPEAFTTPRVSFIALST